MAYALDTSHSPRFADTGTGSIFSRFGTIWARIKEYRDRRDAFAVLLHLDERMLDDIGLSRGDIQWAARLPLKVNAALELRRISENRKSTR
ncbi:MAG: DUF1127 domain-containing protein [Pseudomonadota bacterium]